jgi:hypothetical protein
MLPPLHLFIKQEARQGEANRLLGNGCSYVPLLLTPRDKFVTLNIFVRKYFVDSPTRED